MDPIGLIIVILVITGASIFNYFMNWAPGSEPADFEIGPKELHIRCDCFLNVLIIGGIVSIALTLYSFAFTREELYLTVLIAFLVITLSGVLGRRRRYQEWKELAALVERAMPMDSILTDRSIDIFFDEDTDEDDEL